MTTHLLDRYNVPLLAQYPLHSDVPQSLSETLADGSPLASPDAPILVPLDMSAESEAILEPITRLASDLQSTLHLLHVIPEVGRAMAFGAEIGIYASCRYSVEIGEAVGTICRVAQREGAALIAMATHAPDAVVRQSHLPVLLIHSDETDRGG